MPWRRIAGICAALALTTGCALLPLGRYASSVDPSASASPQESAESLDGDSGEPGGPNPGASNPQAIPDPLHPIKHSIGDRVEVGGVTFTYLGLEESGGELRARFAVESGSLASARLLTPTGEIVDLNASGSGVVSEPFGSAAAPPAKMSTLTLLFGKYLVPFEVGSPH